MVMLNARIARLATIAALLSILDGAIAGELSQRVIPRRADAASSTSLASCEAQALRHREVMIAAQMVNWEPVDDRSALIWTGNSTRAYLVRLAQPLAGMREEPIITLVDGDEDGTISPCGQDTVVLGEESGVASDRAPRARIVSIRLLSAKRTAQLDPGAHPPPLASART